MLITKLQKAATTISLVVVYLTLWHVATIFEYAPFASLWYAPAGLSVAILMLWKRDGFIKVWLCVWCVSVLTQYTYFDNPSLLRVILVSTSAAFTHTVPYWLALKAFNKTQTVLASTSESVLLRPILYAIYILAGALGAALFGILSQIAFADMTFAVAKAIWLGWWLGDYVGAIVLAPFFIFIGCKYLSNLTEPENSFLLHHSETKSFFPKETSLWYPWILIVLLPSTIAIARVEFDDRIPVVLAFLLALLPIAILSTRNTWGVLVSSTVSSSILIIITVKYFGVLGDAITYQATLLAIAVTSLYFYDLVKSFDLRAQELIETEHTLSMASKLLTLNEIGTNIAHELSTPLQTALSSSQRVRRRLEKRDDDWSIEIEELNYVKAAINQASNTVESVRRLVKTPQSNPSHCNIGDALQLARKLSESNAREYDVQMYIKENPKQMRVKIGQSELTQILLNLISNGVRSAAETVAKTVTITVGPVNESSVFIKVTDSGNGVDASNVHSLFKFGDSKSKDGLGLGLWSSRSIAERCGGTLEYIYNDDEDRCFRLTLTRLEPEQ
jgi:signal transduction histidine kinase